MGNEKSSMEKVNKFRDDRDCRQFHNEKDLAISISLEASELLELFQWKSAEEVKEFNLERIKEELTDNLNLNIDSIIDEKLKKTMRNIR